MEQRIITDKNGNPILPITHMRAVRDNDGNNLESVFGSFVYDVSTMIDERMDDQEDMIERLNGNTVEVVSDHTQVTVPDDQTIYREQGTNTYTDYMYQNSAWKKVAEYQFPGIDDEPISGSTKIISSDGVYEALTDRVVVGNIVGTVTITDNNG